MPKGAGTVQHILTHFFLFISFFRTQHATALKLFTSVIWPSTQIIARQTIPTMKALYLITQKKEYATGRDMYGTQSSILYPVI